MNNLTLFQSKYHLNTTSNSKVIQGMIPGSLYRQAYWVKYLLYFTWLSISLPILVFQENKLLTLLSLLPGLSAAVYFKKILFHHLVQNHRLDEQDNILPTLGAGNWITLFRGAAIVSLATLLPLALYHDPQHSERLSWLCGCLYLTISLADLLDGFVARKQQHVTKLGKKLDIEADGAGLLAASLIGISLGRLPEIYLLVGLAYYFYIFGCWWRIRHDRPVIMLRHRPYGRIIAGCQMGLVAMALLPVFASVYAHLAAVIFMTPFLLGFLRDWLVVSGRLQTDRNQISRFERLLADNIHLYISPVVRLFIAAGGVLIVMANEVSDGEIVYLAGFVFLCLLVMLGWMGRFSALLLVLILSLNHSPFGSNIVVMILFSAAAVVVLFGSGPLSLWAPEENILYRRQGNRPGKSVEI